MELVHLHPIDFQLGSAQSLRSLSSLELALVQFHPEQTSLLTLEARKVWHRRRKAASPQELDAFSSTRGPQSAPRGFAPVPGGPLYHPPPSQPPPATLYPLADAPTFHADPLAAQSPAASRFHELISVLADEALRGCREPFATTVEEDWRKRTGGNRLSFLNHVAEADQEGIVKRWHDSKQGDWLELVPQQATSPFAQMAPPPPPAPVLGSANFHLADLGFSIPPVLSTLNSVQLLSLQFHADFDPHAIRHGTSARDEVEDIWMRRCTRDSRHRLVWVDPAPLPQPEPVVPPAEEYPERGAPEGETAGGGRQNSPSQQSVASADDHQQVDKSSSDQQPRQKSDRGGPRRRSSSSRRGRQSTESLNSAYYHRHGDTPPSATHSSRHHDSETLVGEALSEAGSPEVDSAREERSRSKRSHRQVVKEEEEEDLDDMDFGYDSGSSRRRRRRRSPSPYRRRSSSSSPDRSLSPDRRRQRRRRHSSSHHSRARLDDTPPRPSRHGQHRYGDSSRSRSSSPRRRSLSPPPRRHKSSQDESGDQHRSSRRSHPRDDYHQGSSRRHRHRSPSPVVERRGRSASHSPPPHSRARSPPWVSEPSPAPMFIDPYSPVPRDIVHSLLHLRIHFASGTLPRDLLNRGSLHSLFVNRHKAVGWRFETSRQDQPTFRLLFHDRRTLATAGEWFQYAAGYWRSNILQVAEVYLDAAGTSQLWYWSEMSVMFRQSFGVGRIVGGDLERSVEGQGWTPFAFERKTSRSSRRRNPSTRWAPVGCEASDFGGGAPLAKRVSARQASAEPPFLSNTDDCGTSLTLAARVAEDDGAEIAAVEDAPSSEAQKDGEGIAAEAHVAAEEGEVVEEAVDARADVQAVKGEGEGEDVEMG